MITDLMMKLLYAVASLLIAAGATMRMSHFFDDSIGFYTILAGVILGAIANLQQIAYTTVPQPYEQEEDTTH